NIVMKWDWGNSGSPDIYHDTETRKNAISYRSNLARLAEQLLIEEQPEKAEKVLDLAMENMPVQYFGYYTLLEPYITGYFEVGKSEKAINLYKEVVKKYKEKLTYFDRFDLYRQHKSREEIVMEIERYRSLVGTLLYGEDEALLKSEAEEFNVFLKKFGHLYSGKAQEETFEEDEDSLDIFEGLEDMDEETFLRLLDSLNNISVE